MPGVVIRASALTQPYIHGEPEPYRGQTTAVGSYPPNAWGLYDRHGNVSEWCYQVYDRKSRKPHPERFRKNGRVLRGGSWVWYMQNCRSAWRDNPRGLLSSHDIGCRVGIPLK